MRRVCPTDYDSPVKNEERTDTCNSLEESGKGYVEQKQPDAGGHAV